MSETKIDFVPQTYPLYVPVMPHIPWLPPSEGEGLWRAKLAELTDEALADEISRLLSVYPVIGWRVSPQAVVPVTPADPLDYLEHDLAEYIRESAEAVRATILARYRRERDYAQTASRLAAGIWRRTFTTNDDLPVESCRLGSAVVNPEQIHRDVTASLPFHAAERVPGSVRGRRSRALVLLGLI